MDRVYVSMGSNSNKNSQIKILKPHAHLCIIGRKSTKFQMNPMKDVEGVEETRFLTYSTSSYHSKKVYIISNESNERCRRSFGDKIKVGKV